MPEPSRHSVDLRCLAHHLVEGAPAARRASRRLGEHDPRPCGTGVEAVVDGLDRVHRARRVSRRRGGVEASSERRF